MSKRTFSRFLGTAPDPEKSGAVQEAGGHTGPEANQRTNQETDHRAHRQTSRTPALGGWLRWSPALGVAAVLIYAVGNDAEGFPFLRVLALGLSVGAAASAVGALIGFLFGLPRTLDVTAGTASPAPARAALTTNTNLEEISDWLTKILVGIGLVQLGAFVSQLSELGDSLAPGLGGASGADAFAVGLVVYCLIDGFLLGYLWTRIVVSIRLKDAQRLLQATDEVLSTPLPPAPPAPPPAPPGTETPEQPPPPPPPQGTPITSTPVEPPPSQDTPAPPALETEPEGDDEQLSTPVPSPPQTGEPAPTETQLQDGDDELPPSVPPSEQRSDRPPEG